MSKPRISVVMPVYNGAKYLREAIESILRQTFQDFEFIIINDGSTDESESIILAYDDHRIVYLNNENNVGICVTLNKGYSVAQGEYIVRMDCDDISLPNRFQEQLTFMENHVDIAVVGSDVIAFGDNVIEHQIVLSHSALSCQMGLIFSSCCAHPSVMIRKSMINKYNLQYKEEYRGLEDYELWWQISKVSKITNIAKPLLKYRIHSTQITQNYDQEYWVKTKRFLDVRMNDIGVHLSETQNAAMLSYCTSNINNFTREDLDNFIHACQIINKAYMVKGFRAKKALKSTLSQAILAIVKHSNLKHNAKTVIRRIRKIGLLPTVMYLKLLYYQLKGDFQ